MGAEEMFDIVDYDEIGSISLEEFTNGCMKGRGTAMAKDLLSTSCQVFAVKDMVRLVLEQLSDQGIFGKRLKSIESQVEQLGDGSFHVPVERDVNISEKHGNSNGPIPSPRPSSAQKHVRHMTPSFAGQSQMKRVWGRAQQQIELLNGYLHEMPGDSGSWELTEALGGVESRIVQINEDFFPWCTNSATKL